MQSVGSFFSTVSKFYNEINPATLSGAIDVVVVEQANGDLACSPFHVRFGKLSILRPQEKVVSTTTKKKGLLFEVECLFLFGFKCHLLGSGVFPKKIVLFEDSYRGVTNNRYALPVYYQFVLPFFARG
jgi:hypothetical protein